jgi:PAS domain S-box-containing protein
MTAIKILIVEDNGIVALDIQSSLKSLGYDVAGIAPSGEEALCKAEQTRPDIVLMDINLPGEMGGIGASAQIRTLLNVPVVYLTAHAEEKVIERAKITEPFGYIIKPFRDRELHSAIEIALYKHKAESTLKKANDELDQRVAERTAELSESKELLEKIFTSQLDAILILSSSTPVIIKDCNPAALQLFGYRREQMIGQSTKILHIDATHQEDFQKRIYRQIRDAGFFRLKDVEVKRRDGSVFPVEISGVQLLNEQKDRIGWVSVFRDISEQKKYEYDLKRSEENFRTIADFTYDWETWLGTNRKFIYVSPSCERITGYPREAFMRNYALLLDMIHPDDRAGFAHHLEFDQNYHRVHNVDFRIITRSGETRWISHYCQPVFNKQGEWLGRRGSNRDITDQKQAENKLKENRGLLQGVFDGISEPLILMRKDLSIIMMNKAAAEYYKTPINDAACGKPCFDVFRERTEPCVDCPVPQAVSAAKHLSFERKGFLDATRIEHVTVYPTSDIESEADAAILRIQDITTERQMEQELVQADKMISLGILVSGVAHEINNPNNFIMINAPLLMEVWESVHPILDNYYETHGDFATAGLPYSEMKEEVPNLLNGIEEGSKRIQRIVKDLKEYSRRDMGQMDESIHINDIVKQSFTLLQSLVKASTTMLSVKYGRNLPSIMGNSQKLEQVMINLIQNACQALQDKGKGIQVTTAYDNARGDIIVTVHDEGTGIPDDALPHIMDPFFTTKRHSGGVGLGLSVSSNILKEHDGKIEVRSEPGKGSTFIVRLPVEHEKLLKKILVVDDDREVRKTIITALSRTEKYSVQEASTGTEASIKLGIERPDLIILDIQMPGVDGVEICRLIKTNPALAGTRVIIITGFRDSPKAKKIEDMGFKNIFSKPFKIHVFLTMVDRTLNEKI